MDHADISTRRTGAHPASPCRVDGERLLEFRDAEITVMHERTRERYWNHVTCTKFWPLSPRASIRVETPVDMGMRLCRDDREPEELGHVRGLEVGTNMVAIYL